MAQKVMLIALTRLHEVDVCGWEPTTYLTGSSLPGRKIVGIFNETIEAEAALEACADKIYDGKYNIAVITWIQDGVYRRRGPSTGYRYDKMSRKYLVATSWSNDCLTEYWEQCIKYTEEEASIHNSLGTLVLGELRDEDVEEPSITEHQSESNYGYSDIPDFDYSMSWRDTERRLLRHELLGNVPPVGPDPRTYTAPSFRDRNVTERTPRSRERISDREFERLYQLNRAELRRRNHGNPALFPSYSEERRRFEYRYATADDRRAAEAILRDIRTGGISGEWYTQPTTDWTTFTRSDAGSRNTT